MFEFLRMQLKTAQRQTTFRETGDMLTRLLRLSVGTGMLTGTCSCSTPFPFSVRLTDQH